MIYSYIIFRFSDIFYIDATNQQTLEADLIAISPTNIEQSVAGCQQWLASQHGQNWLLFFDNADENANAKVADMDSEDAKYLLMHISHAENRSDNEKLAALIVKVIFDI